MIPGWMLGIALAFFSLFAGVAINFYLTRSFRNANFWGWLSGFFLVGIISLFIRNDLINRETKAKQPVYSGFLTPANESGPPLPDGVPNNTIQLLLGDDLRVLSASKTPVLSFKDIPFLTIGIKDNLINITTDVFDFQNRQVARIIENEFQVSQKNAFNPLQPDKHSLIVRDAKGHEVLNVRFMNKKTIRIVGRFHASGMEAPILILPDDGLKFPGGGGISHLTLDMTKSEDSSAVNFK